ncbi:MAG: PDZ domain-containing protein [Bacteroidota bacterium]
MRNNVYLRSLFLLLLFCLTSGYVECGAQVTGGIGAVLKLDTAKDGTTLPRIQNVVPGSPAAQSLKDGLYIVAVNDLQCKNESLEKIVGAIRGEVGTKVSIAVTEDQKGKHAKAYVLVRAAIQQPGPGTQPADPTEAFYAECDAAAKKLKREGNSIVKTFTSECGSYFFNFDADAGKYVVKLMVLNAKGTGANGFETNAKVFNGSNEPAATVLKAIAAQDRGALSINTLTGEISFSAESVGVVSVDIKPLADVTKCKAMYLLVYKPGTP